MEFKIIKVKEIATNPFNPRKNFSGRKFDELVQSIREKGVIEPIVVRPQNGRFEVVAGERRLRAARAIDGAGEIPAIVRELDDDHAFELMTIENLQREDLTALEEARSFKCYLDKKGMEALPELAARTGIHPGYIRRRMAVLKLPARVLKAWEKGELKYGHLEQLARVGSKKDIGELVCKIFDWEMTVKDLAGRIVEMAPLLKIARFDLKNEGCIVCGHNSEVQRQLFDIDDGEKACCLKPACFKQKQHDYFAKNWKKRKVDTVDFRFSSDVSYDDWEGFYRGGPYKDCRACANYISIIDLDGNIINEKICLDKSCLQVLQKERRNKRSKNKTAGNGDAAARVAWHGEYFREKFYQERLPQIFAGLKISIDNPDAVEKKERLALFALLNSNTLLHEWFAEKVGQDPDHIYLTDEQLFRPLEKMGTGELGELLKEATLKTVVQNNFGPEGRRLVADHLGVDLKAEWRIDEEYLDKKTKAEILAIAEKFGVFEQRAAKDFLFNTLIKKRGKFKSCNKGELKRIFLESGVDLAGVVPEEILGGKEGVD